MKLVLFDIDGTLLNCGWQPLGVFSQSLTDVFGTCGAVDGFDFAGRTDPGIVLDLITGAGISKAEVLEKLPRMREIYTRRLEASLVRDGMRLLPGVMEILERLATREDVVLSLLTGNWGPGARTKLSRFDLNRFFTFGAFGCDGIDRSDLPPVALARAEREIGRRFRPEETLIVGDSVHDVSCAHAHGIPCLAVLTGRTPAETLQEAGADWIVEDLRQATSAVPWLE